MGTKLHELLAVDGGLKTQAEKTRGDLKNTFEKKRHLFTEKKVTFTPLAEGAAQVIEDQLDLQTTVGQELNWITGIWSKAFDVAYRVAEGNTVARADLTLDDGTLLLSGVPATALLELDKRAREIHDLATHIPTLDPAKGYAEDATYAKPGVYRARPEVRWRTAKIQKPLTLAPATDKHPAQVQMISVDEPVGTVNTQEWSGLITPAEKAAMLERAERLQRAVKSALARANNTEVPEASGVGAMLLNFVFKG